MNIYNKPILTTSPNNTSYRNQQRVLNSYKQQPTILRTTAPFNNDLTQFTANNNIQKELINNYEQTHKNKYVNIDDDIELYNPNIEYNKRNGSYTNTIMRYIDHYINIDSSLRRKEPIITYDGNYITLESNCLQLTKGSNLMFVKCNKSFNVDDKIILEGATPLISGYIDSQHLTFTEGSNAVSILITDKNIINVLPLTNDDDIYLEISNFNNYDIYSNPIDYIGNVPISVINDVHIFSFQKDNDNIIITFELPFKYHASSTYHISSIIRTFKISFLCYSNIPIYNINAFYPLSTYANQPYHIIKEVNNNGFYVDVIIKAQNDLSFGSNIRIRKIKKYENGYKEPNNYVLELTETYKNVVSVEMISSEFPCTENTIYKNKTIKSSIVQGYNDNNQEIIYTQNNKFYWQNQDDGNYTYSIELDVGKYSIDNLIKEIEDKVYNTPRQFYIDTQLYNNHNVIKIDCNIEKDLITFRSYNEYDFNNIFVCRCDELGNEDENGDYMILKFNNDETSVIINDIEYQLSSITYNNTDTSNNYNYYITTYDYNDYVYIKNVFRLLFNYNDTFGSLLGFSDVGNNTSITQYADTITNKMLYHHSMGLIISNDDINIGNSINMIGHNYLLIVCKELPIMDNVLNINKNQAFSKILLYGACSQVDGSNYSKYMGGNYVYNTFVKMNKIFYTPIHEISKLSFEFYAPTGELYDFNGMDHSFTLKITTLENILDNTNINSHSESTI